MAEASRRFSDDAADLAASIGSSLRARSLSPVARGWRAKLGLGHYARRTLGIALLLVTVFLWTLSNFLASFIFSDHTYDKPFFLLYMNTSVFAFALVPRFTKYILRSGLRGLRNDTATLWRQCNSEIPPPKVMFEADETGERLLVDDDDVDTVIGDDDDRLEKLSFRATSRLSLEFCMLWFLANYFASACLGFTSVASVTILTSTSSIWTLIFCALFRIEAFSMRKFIGVMASLTGVVLISTVDLTGAGDGDRGSFPDKTTGQVAIGDAMAFLSSVVYGVYVTVMKRRVGNEDRVDMNLFFGMVGVFNLLFLWPLFFILHWTNIEPFEMPPTARIWTIVVVNSCASWVSDMAWAYAMLLTTPLVVTVGLSLTIPLSLIGEMIQYGMYSSFVYWVGAAIVLSSFVFVNHESREDEDDAVGH
ncbi:vacuolar membrane protein [Emericellopsis atlantica]|uniref:Vacuolar membrane protein n=1 Tax=Emericellopsis atlantica TaxID=2614577 RepID=A0A9P7ZFN3_9HYPO|nr:vacuolar membrane protein [Emericellopsis atlantica]KAG9250942.1 vacuolar membrane protein [Emericellopsis atlantica]